MIALSFPRGSLFCSADSRVYGTPLYSGLGWRAFVCKGEIHYDPRSGCSASVNPGGLRSGLASPVRSQERGKSIYKRLPSGPNPFKGVAGCRRSGSTWLRFWLCVCVLGPLNSPSISHVCVVARGLPSQSWCCFIYKVASLRGGLTGTGPPSQRAPSLMGPPGPARPQKCTPKDPARLPSGTQPYWHL